MNNDNAPKTPHPHAELIKASADGTEIQRFNPPLNELEDCFPLWLNGLEYSIKHEDEENED